MLKNVPHHIYKRSTKEGVPGTPVQISQIEWEFNTLLNLYQKEQPKRVLEIGTHYGGSLYQWLHHATADTVVVAVDLYHLNEHMYAEWTPPDVKLITIRGDSKDENVIGITREYAPYDWVFIDGSHVYEDVKSDWETYRFEANTVILHDINYHPECGVDKLWREIQGNGYITQELRADPAFLGCGIGIVYRRF